MPVCRWTVWQIWRIRRGDERWTSPLYRADEEAEHGRVGELAPSSGRGFDGRVAQCAAAGSTRTDGLTGGARGRGYWLRPSVRRLVGRRNAR